MDPLKTQIQLKLIGNLIIDWCGRQDGLLFDPAFCSQERCIRFTTPALTEVFPPEKAPAGAWKNGHFLMYEVFNEASGFRITCSLGAGGNKAARLLKQFDSSSADERGIYALRAWDFSDAACDAEKIIKALSHFYENERPVFEEELVCLQKPLTEGSAMNIHATRYERNPEARRKCIEARGAFCNICGFDYGKVYGEPFTGMIEVHHILPLHTIRKEYTVDPVRDLIPVCSNCHWILHSKANGDFYTPEEVKRMLQPKTE